MVRYVIRRLLGALLVLLIVSFVTFGLLWLPSKISSNPNAIAYLYLGKAPSQAQVEAFTKAYGLDKPFIEQYFNYVVGIFRGRTFSDGSIDGVRETPHLALAIPSGIRHRSGRSSKIAFRSP